MIRHQIEQEKEKEGDTIRYCVEINGRRLSAVSSKLFFALKSSTFVTSLLVPLSLSVSLEMWFFPLKKKGDIESDSVVHNFLMHQIFREKKTNDQDRFA